MSPPTRRWISSPSHFNRSARLCDWPITLVPDHVAVITDGVAAYLPQSESLCSGYGNLQPQTVAACFWTCSKIVSTSWSVLHSSAAILCPSHTGVQTCVSVPTTIINAPVTLASRPVGVLWRPWKLLNSLLVFLQSSCTPQGSQMWQKKSQVTDLLAIGIGTVSYSCDDLRSVQSSPWARQNTCNIVGVVASELLRW